MFYTIAHISLKLNWKYTKFCRQIATCKGYLWPKLESTQNKNKNTLFSCYVIVKLVVVIIKFVIIAVTSTCIIDYQITNSLMLLRF